MRIRGALLFVIALGCLCGCQNSDPLMATPPPLAATQPPASPPPPPVPLAALAISNLTVTVVPLAQLPNPLEYDVRFDLTETNGVSGATIEKVETWTGDEGEIVGPQCWRQALRVPPGGTLDAFGAKWDDLGYCAPVAFGRSAHLSVALSVTYADDQGTEREVHATAVPVGDGTTRAARTGQAPPISLRRSSETPESASRRNQS